MVRNGKRLHFDYHMQITYSKKVSRCYYTLKCIPLETQMQHLEEVCIELIPASHYERGTDSFGNQTVYGCMDQEHDQFSFHVFGNVITGLADSEGLKDESMLGMYRYPHGLICPGEELSGYFKKIPLREEASAYEKGVFLMQRLYQDFCYEKNVTSFSTTAEEAWKLGRGVCQDYAQIFIALCRLAGIPARYVAGMLIGEGYSHAWAEILSEGKWYGLDPTNNLIVTDSHIKLGQGRDASDCMINRGLFFGGGGQTQAISVHVEEI